MTRDEYSPAVRAWLDEAVKSGDLIAKRVKIKAETKKPKLRQYDGEKSPYFVLGKTKTYIRPRSKPHSQDNLLSDDDAMRYIQHFALIQNIVVIVNDTKRRNDPALIEMMYFYTFLASLAEQYPKRFDDAIGIANFAASANALANLIDRNFMWSQWEIKEHFLNFASTIENYTYKIHTNFINANYKDSVLYEETVAAKKALADDMKKKPRVNKTRLELSKKIAKRQERIAHLLQQSNGGHPEANELQTLWTRAEERRRELKNIKITEDERDAAEAYFRAQLAHANMELIRFRQSGKVGVNTGFWSVTFRWPQGKAGEYNVTISRDLKQIKFPFCVDSQNFTLTAAALVIAAHEGKDVRRTHL
jgi:hypothetical protein